MNKQFLFLLCATLPLFCLAQGSLVVEYSYDDAGNRILRKIITVQFAPPLPPTTDSLEYDSVLPLESNDLMSELLTWNSLDCRNFEV